MIFGTSKDFGTCKSLKKNGEKCTAIVNVNKCEFCLYHIKQEYQKCSQRSELQSNFVGRGLVALRNKVLGKNEVFYAGKSYMAIPAKKSRKLEQKDNNRLDCLNGLSNNIVKAKNRGVTKKKQNAARFDVSHAQRLKDYEMLKKLGGTSDMENKTNFTGHRSADVTLEESKSNALNVISKLKAKQIEKPKDIHKDSQYNRKNDLIVNIDNKKNFTGKMSEEISLDESRRNAKSVIAKLKGNTTTKFDQNQTDDHVESETFTDEINFDDDFDLNYDDVDLIGKNEKENNNDVTNKQINTKNKIQSPKISNKNSEPSINKIVSPKTPNKKENTNPKIITTPNTTALSSKQTLVTTNQKTPKSNDILSPKNSNATKLSKTIPSHPKPELPVPTLSRFGATNGLIDLNEPVKRKTMTKAKLNALKFVQANGPIKKIDPNNIKGSSSTPTSGKKKRSIKESDVEEMNPKKSKLAESDLISDRFKRMMAVKSRHTDLLEQIDDEAQEKYFKKQEIKEQMEEKMANTFKIACKGVRCLKCKYTSFSAADICKKEGHPLKVFDAMKRFFKCGNCQNRTVSLEVFPTKLCTNCGSGKWERTGMMKEKVVGVVHQLSIRGGEQKFVNSVVADANVNLLVPDND